eukprot:20618-Heterococcus_DN1.PRE.3
MQASHTLKTTACSCTTIYIFVHPLHLPLHNCCMSRTALAIIRRLSPALQEDVTGAHPYLISPLAATAQALRVDAPGTEAKHTALLGGVFAQQPPPSTTPATTTANTSSKSSTLGLNGTANSGETVAAMSALTAAQRKRHLSNATNLAAHSFDPRYVYTFDFYQHLYDP